MKQYFTATFKPEHGRKTTFAGTKCRQWAGLLLTLVLLFSCSQDEQTSAPRAFDSELSIGLEIPGSDDDGYITYALSSQEEINIEHISVLAFEYMGGNPDPVSNTGKFLYRAGVIYAGPNPTSCKIRVKNMPIAQTFVVIANARKYVDNATLQEQVTTKAQAIQSLLMTGGQFNSSTSKCIPMWGEVQNITVNGNAPAPQTVKLYRSLAKINVKNSASNFVLTEVNLYMPRTKGTLIPGNWGEYTGSISDEPNFAVTTPTQPEGAVPEEITKYTYTATANEVENEIYTYEADNKTQTDKLKQVCLVVKGNYTDNAVTTNNVYYRIDLKVGSPKVQLDVLRNFIYNITISNVGGMGVDNADDAFKGLSVIEAGVEPWNAVTGEMQVGASHLYVSQPYPWVKLDGTTEPFEGSKTLKIKTSDPAGWKWKNDATTKATLAAFGVTTTGGAKDSEVTVNWTPNDITTSMPYGRDGEAVIVSGNMEYKIHFMQDNCGRMGIALKQDIGGTPNRGTYLTHRFGSACWMVENLRVGTIGNTNGTLKAPVVSVIGYANDGNPIDFTPIEYDGTGLNEHYYTWEQAQNACPNGTASKGWVLPTSSDWIAGKWPNCKGDLADLLVVTVEEEYFDNDAWYWGDWLSNSYGQKFWGQNTPNYKALAGIASSDARGHWWINYYLHGEWWLSGGKGRCFSSYDSHIEGGVLIAYNWSLFSVRCLYK